MLIFFFKLDCKSSSSLLLQHDHVDMILFQVGRSLVAPNSNFSTKYYNTILFQICLAHKLSLTKFKPGIVIYRQINIQTLLLHINKSLVNSKFWSAPKKFLIKFKPYCWISTNQHSNPTFYIRNQQLISKFQAQNSNL
jgi:hypothetical protein